MSSDGEIILYHPGGPQMQSQYPYKREIKVDFSSSQSEGDSEASCFAAGCEDGERNYKPRDAKNAALEVAKDKKADSSQEISEGV